jgi:hypothetical protein
MFTFAGYIGGFAIVVGWVRRTFPLRKHLSRSGLQSGISIDVYFTFVARTKAYCVVIACSGRIFTICSVMKALLNDFKILRRNP